MPSDDRVTTALEALAGPRDDFRSAVASADEEVRVYRMQRDGAADPSAALARELGAFAQGRIDAARLGGLLAVADAPDPLTDRLMDVAHGVFAGVMAGDATAFHVRVPAGEDLRDAVRDALAALGRAFGVAHAVERARAGRYAPDSDHGLLHTYPFHRWSTRERRLAPPLVISVDGADLRAGGLAEFVDGGLKMILVVAGACPPAPLARLIAPDTFVAQTSDAALLPALGRHAGPGVVAFCEADSGAVSFVHDPPAGARTWQRLHVAHAPDALRTRLADLETRGRTPGAACELRHLLELAEPPDVADAAPVAAGTATAAAGPAAADPADRLAAWLLARTDLDGL
jgi:hypothetical protein